MSDRNPTGGLPKFGRLARSFIKRYIYAQLAVFSGLKIAFGKEDPFIRFTVEKSPPSIYWVFKFKPAVLDGLEQILGISEGFSISSIQCLDSDHPENLLVLNVYRVSGLANGLRAEWSTFIRDADHIPRYMILDAGASQLSMDPIHIFTRPEVVVHEQNGNTVNTQFRKGEKAFSSTLTIPDDAPPVSVSDQWVTANDNIYWTNGIYDQTFYNAGLANARQLQISAQNAAIELGAFYRLLVEPEPMHILLLQNQIEFVVSPWKNIINADANKEK